MVYVDPYNSKGADLDVFFAKHFRYWCQREYRFAWIPPMRHTEALEPFFVELGPLTDKAELVAL